MIRLRTAATLIALASVGLALTSCGGSSSSGPSTPSGAKTLIGVFQVTKGSCTAGRPIGSYFRMVQPNGKPGIGPYVANGDSSCSDKTITPMTPGSEGGIRTGVYQPQPTTPFDAKGNSESALIVAPTKWFAVAFGIATNRTDPQTKRATATPTITVTGDKLTGDLSSFAATWNGQHFNQGAPKPGGARPGQTTGPTGSYDASTKSFTLNWTSQIVGGPFNNFTGVWHLEGTFRAA